MAPDPLPVPRSDTLPDTLDFGLESLEPVSPDDSLLLDLSGPACDDLAPRPARVTVVLSLAFRAPGGTALDAARLSLIDRQAALIRLATSLGTWPADFIAACERCGAGNRMRVAPAEFVHRPGPRHINHAGQRFMAPNGAHETRLAAGGRLALSDLACPNDAGQVTPLPSTDVASVLDRFAAEGPGFDPALPWHCVACGTPARFWFDPLAWIAAEARSILTEIHTIARAYGWTESAILALPQGRRRTYLSLIGGAS